MRCLASANNAAGRLSAVLASGAELVCVRRETSRGLSTPCRDKESQAADSEIPLLCFRDRQVAARGFRSPTAVLSRPASRNAWASEVPLLCFRDRQVATRGL